MRVQQHQFHHHFQQTKIAYSLFFISSFFKNASIQNYLVMTVDTVSLAKLISFEGILNPDICPSR